MHPDPQYQEGGACAAMADLIARSSACSWGCSLGVCRSLHRVPPIISPRFQQQLRQSRVHVQGARAAAAGASPLLYAPSTDSCGLQVEYETRSQGIPSMRRLSDNDVPCAVCQRRQPSRVVMVPGRGSCPEAEDGATALELEYAGFLFSERYNHNRCAWRGVAAYRLLPRGPWRLCVCVTHVAWRDGRGEYVCVDTMAEGVYSSGNENAALLYPTEMAGGTDAVYPYRAYYEISCAVCALPEERAVFTHWGREDCPGDADRLWSGPAAGRCDWSRHLHAFPSVLPLRSACCLCSSHSASHAPRSPLTSHQ